MADVNGHLIPTGASSPGDAEAIQYLEQAIAGGEHWYIALLGAIGLWTSASEVYNERSYRYLIDGEAFDWLLLAERLCETVDYLLPEDEKNELLFHGVPPLELTAGEVKELIGDRKYGQYLNYFYGVTVEEALLLAVQDEIGKERRVQGFRNKAESLDEAYLRIYNVAGDALLKQFRHEKGYTHRRSIALGEMNEFTYWLFKYRLKQCEKARIASDTKKALGYLKRQWRRNSIFKILIVDLVPDDIA